jgi:hypothetical protein
MFWSGFKGSGMARELGTGSLEAYLGTKSRLGGSFRNVDSIVTEVAHKK